MYSEDPNVCQAKFLIGELLTILGLLEDKDFDDELTDLIEQLQIALN